MSQSSSNAGPNILVVDDSSVDRCLVGGLLAKDPSLALDYVTNGQEAVDYLEKRVPTLVVTDLIMPHMDGLTLVSHIVRHYPRVPVILMTGNGSEETAVTALKAGASSYVPKRLLGELLLETVNNLLSLAREEQKQERLMDCMMQSECTFVLDTDASMISPLVNYLHRIVRSVGLCDEPNGIRVCVALEEALNNALFHGNLELDSDLRESDRQTYLRLVEQRRQSSPYRDRNVYVEVNVSRAQGSFVIRDEGPGFDPEQLPDPTDPANLEKASGRGLLLMRTFMDDVIFNGAGNQVTMIKRLPADDRS